MAQANLIQPSFTMVAVIPLGDVPTFNAAFAETCGDRWSSLANAELNPLTDDPDTPTPATHCCVTVAVREDVDRAVKAQLHDTGVSFMSEGQELEGLYPFPVPEEG